VAFSDGPRPGQATETAPRRGLGQALASRCGLVLRLGAVAAATCPAPGRVGDRSGRNSQAWQEHVLQQDPDAQEAEKEQQIRHGGGPPVASVAIRQPRFPRACAGLALGSSVRATKPARGSGTEARPKAPAERATTPELADQFDLASIPAIERDAKAERGTLRRQDRRSPSRAQGRRAAKAKRAPCAILVAWALWASVR